MPLLTFAVEEFIHWRFGLMGAISLGLLSFGLRARNATAAGAGSIMLALLLHSASG
ncbi:MULTISPECIES: hypothetical protein [unclassified Streptomyces]|uniref:hypothetical protein n=1 Tax=unclassified Streptomyces TaxID=2593676 RepID=UPI0021C9548D|nr:hypothetical protein [Streptomyces sp. FIT100]UUN27713.1 hypothetical protein KK483_15855 [Streptomyces sp. FIT100]